MTNHIKWSYSYSPMYLCPIVMSDEYNPMFSVHKTNNAESTFLSDHKIYPNIPEWRYGDTYKGTRIYPMLPYPFSISASGFSVYFLFITQDTRYKVYSATIGLCHLYTDEIAYLATIPPYYSPEFPYVSTYTPEVEETTPNIAPIDSSTLGFDIIHVNNFICCLYPTFNTKTQQHCSVLTIYNETTLEHLCTFSLCINNNTIFTLFTSMFSFDNLLILESYPNSIHCGYYYIDLTKITHLFTKQHRYYNVTPIYTLPQPIQDYKQTLRHNKNISKDLLYSLQIDNKRKIYKHTYPTFMFSVNKHHFYNIKNVYNYIPSLRSSYTLSIQNITPYTILNISIQSNYPNLNNNPTINIPSLLSDQTTSFTVEPKENNDINIEYTLKYRQVII